MACRVSASAWERSRAAGAPPAGKERDEAAERVGTLEDANAGALREFDDRGRLPQ
jgi:hypothetical protein